MQSVEGIVKKLTDTGIHVIPNFVKDVQPLYVAGIECLKENRYCINYEYSKGILKSVYFRGIPEYVEKPIKSAFRTKFMEDIVKGYNGTISEKVVNKAIYVTKDIRGMDTTVHRLHFDRDPCLKFMIYLNNVTEENGAFSYVPFSEATCREIRNSNKKGISLTEKFRDLPYTDKDLVPITGDAGTLIIFTTEIAHKPGSISKGVRYVMRGHNLLTNKN